MINIYVGNLPFNATEEEVRGAFEEFWAVTSVKLITDRETGQPRGFAFVEMENADEANSAIQALDGQPIGDRKIRVQIAAPKNAVWVKLFDASCNSNFYGDYDIMHHLVRVGPRWAWFDPSESSLFHFVGSYRPGCRCDQILAKIKNAGWLLNQSQGIVDVFYTKDVDPSFMDWLKSIIAPSISDAREIEFRGGETITRW